MNYLAYRKYKVSRATEDPTRHDSDPFKASSVAERERKGAVSHPDGGYHEAGYREARLTNICV